MPWYPRAVRKTVSRFRTSLTPRRVNLHTAVSNASSLYGYFSRSTSPCSHFYVREDGTVEQYVDTSYRAAADLRGNASTISIETWDGWGGSWTSGPPPAWTPAQVTALRDLIDWILATHPTIPRRLATTSRDDSTSWGISWHRLGVPATRLQLLRGASQTGGMLYSRAVGKVCPGDRRIAQIPGLLARTIDTPKAPAPAPAPTPAPAPAVKNSAAVRDYAPGEVKAIQERLYAAGFYTGRIDDDYGPLTAAAVRAYQTAQVYPRLVQDGDWGTVVEAHYAWTVRLQETLNLWKSTSPKLRTDGSLQSVTIAAVARWQTRNRAIYRKHGGRLADGIPGPITAAALGIPAHP